MSSEAADSNAWTQLVHNVETVLRGFEGPRHPKKDLFSVSQAGDGFTLRSLDVCVGVKRSPAGARWHRGREFGEGVLPHWDEGTLALVDGAYRPEAASFIVDLLDGLSLE